MSAQVAAAIRSRGEDAIVAGRAVRGLFARVVNSESLGEADPLRRRTTLTLAGGDASGVRLGDLVNARGQNWKVRDVEGNPDRVLVLVLGNA